MSRRLEIAMFVGSFPELSETFIVRQITGLLDLGHSVDIFSNARPPADSPIHGDVGQYRLLERTTYISGPAESLQWDLPVWPLSEHTWPPGSPTSIPNWRRLAQAVPALVRNFATTPRLTLQTLDSKHYRYQATSLSALYRLSALRSVRKRYDVLHAHFGPVARSFRFARQLWRAPFVVTFHGYDFCAVPRGEGGDVYHSLFPLADAVTVNSDYARQKVIELGCPGERIHKLHVGVNLDQFSYRRRNFNTPSNILSVCRLVEKKGLEYALRAVDLVRQRHPELRYDIIGDGPLMPVLQQLRASLGLEKHVVLHGARDTQFVERRMTDAHVFLLPSVTAENGDQEGTPVSLIEAQASGLPVLSTLHSGIPEVVLDGKSGFLVPERDVPALAEKLGFLLDHTDVCLAFGARGRQHVEAQFDLRKLNRDLEAIYRKIIEEFRAVDVVAHSGRS